MSNGHILVEEPSLHIETLEVKNNEKNETDNNILHISNNSNEIHLIFRNQFSKDTILLIDKTKVTKIIDIINLLLQKLEISQKNKYVRLFFKGRPLKAEESIENIRKLNLYLIFL